MDYSKPIVQTYPFVHLGGDLNLFIMFHLGQWNVSPLPVAEESHLLEAEVSVNAFGTSGTGVDSIDGEVEASNAEFLGTMLEQKTEMNQPLESDNDILVVEESKETAEEGFDQETTLNTTNTPIQVESNLLYFIPKKPAQKITIINFPGH